VLSVPHWGLSGILKGATYRADRAEHRKLPTVTQADVERSLRTQTGLDWVAWGLRCTDSVHRNAMLKKIAGVDRAARRLYPIFRWRKQDIYGYLHARKLPVPGITGGGTINGGVNLRGPTLSWLKKNHPRDYAKVLERFPFAEVAVYRHDVLGIDPITDAKARFRKKKPHAEGSAQAQAESPRPVEGIAASYAR
jgi:3'-phosphoadenosine 5'-phosphosulfate sulfotransferase (PAPS reductase)/FAD synthetase